MPFGSYGRDGGGPLPTRSTKHRVKYVQKPKEQRRGLPSPRRLRDTYATACHKAEINLKVLMNHRWASSDVTEGYVRQSLEHLRTCQNTVCEFLEALLQKQGIVSLFVRLESMLIQGRLCSTKKITEER